VSLLSTPPFLESVDFFERTDFAPSPVLSCCVGMLMVLELLELAADVEIVDLEIFEDA